MSGVLYENLNKLKTLFYSPMLNRFVDNEWYVVHDLHQLFDTWQLDEWKKNGENICMIAKDGTVWELFYLSEEEEDDVYELILWNESYGIKMDRGVLKL